MSLPVEFVNYLNSYFKKTSKEVIAEKIRPPEDLRKKWDLKSLGDYQLGLIMANWHNMGIQLFYQKYNRMTSEKEDAEIFQIVEESMDELRKYFKTLD